jgi:hypothetical protein
MKKALVIISLVFGISSIQAQRNDLNYYLRQEATLSVYFDSLFNMSPGAGRDSLNGLIISSFKTTLQKPESLYFPWKGLGKIGNLSSEDPGLKVFSWSLQQKDGQYKYYALIQYLKESRRKKQEVSVNFLNDQSFNIKNPEMADLSADNWFGALYFKVYSFKHKRKIYYALLGYDFNNQISNKKLVEILEFSKDGEPEFGGEFIMEMGNRKRLIFEYSAEIIMSIKFDERLDMIVFDHLAPFEPILSGNYAFYGPDGSFDGLKFENGSFRLYRDVDARNF